MWYKSAHKRRRNAKNWIGGYDFTGGNWAGKVDASVLMVALYTPSNQPVRAFFGPKPLDSQRNKYMYTYKWTEWQAEGQFPRASFVSDMESLRPTSNWRSKALLYELQRVM